MSRGALRLIFPFLFACLTMPQAALANEITDFRSIGGTLSGTDAGMSLTGSTLLEVATFSGTMTTISLGLVSYSTGALIRSFLQMGGVLASGSFPIQGNGKNWVADGGLFSGAFTGPASWTLTTLANGTHSYTLTAVVTPTMGSDHVQGLTAQLTINTGKGFFNAPTSIAGGDTKTVSFVPELPTLAMLSIGLLAIAGGIRRRLIA